MDNLGGKDWVWGLASSDTQPKYIVEISQFKDWVWCLASSDIQPKCIEISQFERIVVELREWVQSLQEWIREKQLLNHYISMSHYVCISHFILLRLLLYFLHTINIVMISTHIVIYFCWDLVSKCERIIACIYKAICKIAPK